MLNLRRILAARKVLAGTVLGAMAVWGSTPAQATNGQLFTCAGTYKCAMGGAGLGLATDATSAAINPGLVSRMGTEFIVSAGWFRANVKGKAQGTHGNGLGEMKSRARDFPNASMGFNYRINDKWAANFSLYPGGGGATDWEYGRTGGKNGVALYADQMIDWKMLAGQLSAGYSPTEDSSYGLGLVVIRGTMKTDAVDNAFQPPTPGPAGVVDVAWGVGFQIGGVWDFLDDRLTLAADYQSEVFMERFEKYKNTFNSPINRPPTISIGAVVRLTDKTRLAFDAKHIEQTAVRAVSSEPAAEGGFGWKNRWVKMIGVEHDWDDQLTLRAGWNHAKSPIDEGHLFANMLFPGIVEHHFSAGATYKVTQGLELGFSGYWAPRVLITDDGTGDGFSQANAGSWVSHEQFGAQISLRKTF